MTLKKIIASRIVNGKVVEPQREIEMHPLEEASMRADWERGKAKKAIPPLLTEHEEHNMIIENNVEYVRSARINREKERGAALRVYREKQKIFENENKKWITHCLMCEKNGFDKNSYNKEGHH